MRFPYILIVALQIDDLLSTNPGLRSRFSQVLTFPDFDSVDACELFTMQLKNEYDLKLHPDAISELPGLMDKVKLIGSILPLFFCDYSSELCT